MSYRHTIDYFRKDFVRAMKDMGYSPRHARILAKPITYSTDEFESGTALPADDVLIEFAVEFYKVHKHLPRANSGPIRPDSSITWNYIFDRLKTEGRPTIRELVRAYEVEAEKNDLLKKTNLPILLLPTNRRIAEAAIQYRTKHGHLPREGYVYEAQSHWTWGRIIARLKEERGLNLGDVVRLHYERAKIKPDWSPERQYRKPSPLPSNGAILEKALSYRECHGVLPHDTKEAPGIRGCNLSWNTIAARLRKDRGITLSELVLEHDRHTRRTEKGKINAYDIYTGSALFIHQNGSLPTAADKINGYSPKTLTNYFRMRCVIDHTLYTRPNADRPGTYQAFLLASGLAVKENGLVCAISRDVAREIVKEYGLVQS